MTMLLYGAAVTLFVLGVFGMVVSRNVIHMVGCLNVAKSSTAVFLVGIGYRHDAIAPIRSQGEETVPVVDPVVQAIVLIDVIVGAAVTALLLAIAVQYWQRKGSLDPSALFSRR